ncbi:hypothetical protein P0082_11260 [Candidatus Haliotispira prima]|uniref:Methyltransferase FkbM domain-containing protein n=1 Tax=Candidatus Haliotispira prima TaxID=3034016 RepID=A0ABY8MGB9_9SPIO|nr:hypothetical protein P0082_11260 [Candidatus Haliotispira prima]
MLKLIKGIKALLGFPFYVYKNYQLQKKVYQLQKDEREIYQLQKDEVSKLLEIDRKIDLIHHLQIEGQVKLDFLSRFISPGCVKLTLPKELRPEHPENLIRIGARGDGGYVLPASVLAATEVLVTYGIAADYSFEQEFQKRSGARVVAYDESTLGHFADTNFHDRFFQFFNGVQSEFIPKFIGKKEDMISVRETLLPHKDKKICLKFDVEGAEYDVWDELENLPDNVIAIVCELHQIHRYAEKVVKWIEACHLDLVHIHANNAEIFMPDHKLIEFTLVHPDYYVSSGEQDIKYPISGLDYRNVKERRDYDEIEFL